MGITVKLNIPADRWDCIRWERKPSLRKPLRKKPERTLHIRPDRFPARVRGTVDPQTGIVLEDRTSYERQLKEKGLEHLQ